MHETLSADRPTRILIVDDSEANLQLLTRAFGADGYVVTMARDGVQALDAVARTSPDLVLMDIQMPHVNGVAVCEQLKRDVNTRLVPVVLMTGVTDARTKMHGIEAGADAFLSKPLRLAELRARVRALANLKRYTDELESAESVMVTLAQTIEARDASTEGHCERLAEYASALGEALGLSAEERVALRRGGFLHDIGKIAVPDAVLFKAGRLSDEEFELIKRHTVVGSDLCRQLRTLRMVRPIVRHHHERFDGSGYPDGLEGDAIPLLAQIMHVVDVFDALTTARPYKPAFSTARAIVELREEVSRGWHRPDLVETFIDACCGREQRAAKSARPADPMRYADANPAAWQMRVT